MSRRDAPDRRTRDGQKTLTASVEDSGGRRHVWSGEAFLPVKPSKSVDMIRGHSIHYRELARILFFTFGYPIHHNTVKLLWPKSAVPPSPPPTQGAYHARADRVHARLQIVRLY